jgi:hypothetical protein
VLAADDEWQWGVHAYVAGRRRRRGRRPMALTSRMRQAGA